MKNYSRIHKNVIFNKKLSDKDSKKLKESNFGSELMNMEKLVVDIHNKRLKMANLDPKKELEKLRNHKITKKTVRKLLKRRKHRKSRKLKHKKLSKKKKQHTKHRKKHHKKKHKRVLKKFKQSRKQRKLIKKFNNLDSRDQMKKIKRIYESYGINIKKLGATDLKYLINNTKKLLKTYYNTNMNKNPRNLQGVKQTPK